MPSIGRWQVARCAGILVVCGAALVAACSKEATPKPDTTPVDTGPPAIDTSIPTILGVAVNRASGAPSWCLMSSRSDIWTGRPVKVAWTAYHKIAMAKVGEKLESCAPAADSVPGAKAYDLTFTYDVPADPFPAIVLRDDVWGNIGDMYADMNLDGDQLRDTIWVCTTGSVARFKMEWAGEVRRPGWALEVPYVAIEEPRCADAAAPPPDPSAGVYLPSWARLPGSYQLPYGEEWLVLRQAGESSALLRTTVLPMTVPRSCRNDPASGGNGRRLIASAAPDNYVALFSHLPTLTEGPVQEASRDHFGGMLLADSVIMTQNGRTVTLRRETVGTTGFRIVAESGVTRWTLFEVPSSDLGRWNVDWAGDLDRDGEIDFIMTAQQRNFSSAEQLFLSRNRTALQWTPAASYTEKPC